MSYLKLRIAWSMVFGIVTMLLIVLWVRSYRGPGTGYLPVSSVCCRSADGILLVAKFGPTVEPLDTKRRDMQTFSDPWIGKPIDITPSHKWAGFHSTFTDTSFFWIQAPYWFLFAISGAISAAPWIRQLRWQFSLRTLLISTTLVAVVLGVIVWAVR